MSSERSPILALLLLISGLQVQAFVGLVDRNNFHLLNTSGRTQFQFFAEPGDATASIEIPVEISDADRIKQEFLALADRTNRGFEASSTERKDAKELITKLSSFNPTKEPAAPYYKDSDRSYESSTLSGKWTLVYTDAPDITSLNTSNNPLATAKLGRIGQECAPPYIKNVIEWKRPDWASSLPLSGSSDSRILQKVVTIGEADPSKPFAVDLKVGGFELIAGDSSSSSRGVNDFASVIQEKGIPAGLLSLNPVDLKGPLNPPFGKFEVLYLDDEFRVIRTYQGYLAANRRIQPGEEWF